MLRGLAVVLVVVVLLGALVWGLQRRLVYFPSAGPLPAAVDVVPGGQDVVLTTDDGLRLGAWFVPAEPGTDRGQAVLVANGNGGNRAGRVPLARALAADGFSVLLFDYRGYGGNPGSPSREGLALDVRAAHRHLVQERGVPSRQLLYLGESLGCAVVVDLAVDHPPAGLLLRSPFTDLVSVGREHYPWLPVGLVLRDRFDVVGPVTRVDVPVSVVLGTADGVVPPSQSREVARAAPRLHELVEVAGADHNDPVLLDGPQLLAAVRSLGDAVR
ncbi:alpha/beta hydrolase [Thalassiella azotivora]